MFKRVLLAADGSEHSVRSAEKAVQLVIANNGKVDIVYVVDSATSKADILAHSSKYEVARMRKEKLAPIIELLDEKQIEYDVHIIHGEPGTAIVKFANDGDFDCVVVGSRGLNKFQTFVLGSVSHKVAKRVDKPVLIVK
ncbi:universal stress protein [Halalkalibacter hemicellulosilyticus]|uniref:Universal stress protein family n=1 Tax=Halalkalibacter hemicellulosilyticusJCM 9152 TaxID=1236971 RepID=W4QGC9_9BACI|nr:universal stress protein [Halalkalibacter hemicellulosilyticus]GAE31165.1 universal stress protein family [Halalkalibacter hemicellulosilyticusJCM 9152]